VRWRRFWIGVAGASTTVGVVICALYLLNYIDLYELFGGIIAIFFASFFCYMFARAKEVLSEKIQLTLNKIAYIIGGASFGIFVILFGVGTILKVLGFPPLINLLGSWPAIILTLIIVPIVGGLLGYWVGKRRGFQPPRL